MIYQRTWLFYSPINGFEELIIMKNATGFNFGALTMGPVFFGAHRRYGLMIATFLLLFVPGVDLIWCLICGISGASWVRKSSELSDEEFTGSMKTWNRGGLIMLIPAFLAVIGIVLAVAIPGFMSYMENSKHIKEKIEQHQTIQQVDEEHNHAE